MCCVVMVKEGPERNTKNLPRCRANFKEHRGPSAQKVRAVIRKPDFLLRATQLLTTARLNAGLHHRQCHSGRESFFDTRASLV